MLKICIDIDGVVAGFKRDGDTYADVLPIPGAIEKLRAFKKCGHYIILYTARHMKTCQGNIGLVAARVGGVTIEWLKKH